MGRVSGGSASRIFAGVLDSRRLDAGSLNPGGLRPRRCNPPMGGTNNRTFHRWQRPHRTRDNRSRTSGDRLNSHRAGRLRRKTDGEETTTEEDEEEGLDRFHDGIF